MPMRNMLLLGLVAAAIGLVLFVPRHTARPDARAVVVVHAPAAIRTTAPSPAVAPPTPPPLASAALATTAGAAAAPASRTNDAPSEEEWRAVFAAAPGYKEKAR